MLEDVVSAPTTFPRTVLMTTHNLDRGLALGHRTAILARGKLAYQESASSVGAAAVREAYRRYAETTP